MDEAVAHESDSSIVLKVMGPDKTCLRFRIKMLTPLKKLITAYCKQTGLIMGTLRFRFDGIIINENDTPASMNLHDEDMIEVFQSLRGGTNFSDC